MSPIIGRWGPVVPDRNYYRHVGENQKQFSYSAEEGEGVQTRKKKVLNLFGGAPAHPDDGDADGGPGDAGSRNSRNADLTLVGPINYTAPSMKVVQPLEVMAAAASSATAARAGRGGGSGVGGGGGVSGEDRGAMPIPVMLGVNAEEGVMFVHLAFPVTMPKVFLFLFFVFYVVDVAFNVVGINLS